MAYLEGVIRAYNIQNFAVMYTMQSKFQTFPLDLVHLTCIKFVRITLEVSLQIVQVFFVVRKRWNDVHSRYYLRVC